MRKSVFRIITIAAVCFITAVCIFVGADIIKSRQLIIDNAQMSLDYMSENCADEFRAVFDNGEFAVSDLAAVVEETIIVDEIIKDNTYYYIRIEELTQIAQRITQNSKYPISLYITFNPDIFREDIWFVKQLDGNLIDVSAEGEDLDAWLEEWRTDNEFQGFYDETIKSGEMWYETSYDYEINWEVVSRTTAVYDKNGKEIGIVGADIYIGDIEERLAEIDKLTGGMSSVVNSKGELIAGKDIGKEIIEDPANIQSSSDIGELWTVTIIQPSDTATKAIGRMIFVTVILAAFVIGLIVSVMYIVYLKHGKPIIREVEEKDVLLINQARQAQLGEMVGNAAHQLKQPLNGVNMALSNLAENYAEEIEEREAFENQIIKMKSRISNMSETVDDFMMFLRPEKEKRLFSVEASVENVLSLMEERLRIDRIKVEIKGEDFNVYGYENELAQCIFNIVDNARYEMGNMADDRKIIINLKSDGQLGNICIENTGEKIDESVIDNLFDMYFTTKNEGNGIGLYLTKKIIEMHFYGDIRCRNTDNGVCFDIMLPLKEREDC